MADAPPQEITPFSLLGEDGISAFVAAFYRRVALDPLLRPMYPDDDFEGAEARLLSFLLFRLGGPDRYLHERGHPRLRARHLPFPIDSAARDRWLELMLAAMQETSVPSELQSSLFSFFAQVADAMRNRPDPSP